jgi:hypothetical protein
MKCKTASAGLVALVFATTVPAASADLIPIVAAGSIWEYTLTNPTSDPSWNTTTGGWLTGPAPFGNYSGGTWDPDGFFNYATYWPADGVTPDGDDLWVRTSFSTDGFDPSTVQWNLGVDNGYKLYLNGYLVSSHYFDWYTSRWEYSGAFGEYLLPGSNVLAVALEDRSQLTAFDMEVVAQPVPEPGTLLLTGLGFAAMALVRRRRRGQIV